MKNTTEFDQGAWNELKKIFSIHALGLKSAEVKLMQILADSGPMSCGNLAIRLGVNASNIESELEIRPRELGFVRSSSKGRYLSDDGEIYLKSLNAI